MEKPETIVILRNLAAAYPARIDEAKMSRKLSRADQKAEIERLEKEHKALTTAADVLDG